MKKTSAVYDLKPLQGLLFRIYKEVEKVCKRHNLRIYAAWGTALGAVRHKGFIPWDDDLDVYLPRPDYEHFLEIADSELPEWLHTLTWKNCQSYTNLFGKVIVTDPAIVEATCARTGMSAPMGHFIDILPIDGYPTSWIARWLRVLKRGIYKSQGYAILRKWHNVNGVIGRINWLLFKCLNKFFGPNTYREALARQERLLSGIPYETAGRVACTMWYADEKLCAKAAPAYWFDSKDVGNGRDVPFENDTIRIMDCAEKELRFYFGDYMKLPPEDQRHPTHMPAGLADVPWKYGPSRVVKATLKSMPCI